MQSKIVPGRIHRIGNGHRWGDLAQDAGLCVYFCLSCALIAGCAFAFYKLMQPVIYANPAAPENIASALPANQLNAETPAQRIAAEYPPGVAIAFASAVAPEGKPAVAPTKEEAKAKKSERESNATDSKRKHVAKKHDPMMDYAAQPPFGGYPTWGGYQQSWSGNRPSGNYQAPSGNRGWNSYQGWSGYRNGH